MRAVSSLAEKLLASEEGFLSIELVQKQINSSKYAKDHSSFSQQFVHVVLAQAVPATVLGTLRTAR